MSLFELLVVGFEVKNPLTILRFPYCKTNPYVSWSIIGHVLAVTQLAVCCVAGLASLHAPWSKYPFN